MSEPREVGTAPESPVAEVGERRALSLTQPWAALVAIGAKRLETRSWSTRYRGPLAIHAAKGMPPAARTICLTEPFASTLGYGEWTPTRDETHLAVGSALTRGAIVATCTLADVVPVESVTHLRDHERAFGDYSPGRFAWVLTDIRRLERPIECRGALGLWRCALFLSPAPEQEKPQ